MFSKKYILTEIYGEIFFIKIKNVEIYKKVVILPPELNKNKETYYYAKIDVDKIIGILTDKDFKYLSQTYRDESLNDVYCKYNKLVHWDIFDGDIRLNHFKREFLNHNFEKKLTEEDVVITSTNEIYELTTFVNEDGINPFMLEFDTEEDAKLFFELNKNNIKE